MRKLVLVTLVALLASAAPAFAQDEGDSPDIDRLLEKFEKAIERIEKLVEPLLEKLEDVVKDIVAEVESWLEDVDPGEMFGEFDLDQWADELRRMMERLRPGDEDDEEFLRAPFPAPAIA